MLNICTFDVPSILSYIYVPVFLSSFILGLFVFISNKKNPANRNLFIFISFLCFWIISDYATWLIHDVNLNLLIVKLIPLTSMSLVFFLFFSFNFIEKKIEKWELFLVALLSLPIFGLLLTNYNATIYDASTCTFQYGYLLLYVYAFSFFLVAWSVKNLFLKYKQKETESNVKKQIGIIMSSLVFVVSWFILFVGIANSRFAKSNSWGDQIFLFIPIGIVIFIGILTYAITKYRFLKLKLIAAQALTYAVWLLIGAQFFFADTAIVYLLISFTLLLSILFGIFLIRSVNDEIKRKEELQVMADKLASANDQLRKLDNAKTEFISIASHQLRTPITAIKGFASLILEGSYGELNDGVKGAVEKVYASSERLVNLIEDLLNVSRIESGRMQFAFEKADVAKLIKELYDNFILIAKNKNFFLEMKMPETPLPEIVMDYTKIRELVSNFVDNALKYTEQGGATISAEMRDSGVVIDENGFVIPDKKSEFGKVIRITVKDTGIGIPKEEIPYLFKKFSRGKDVSRLHVGGTGLGLYVGKAIAEAHHGQVWVESEGDGKGSSFIIEIPTEHV